MKQRIRAAAILFCLLLLCSCLPQGASSSENPALPSSSGAETIPVDDLIGIASIYESYCSGSNYSKEHSDVAIDFAYGWLRDNDLIESYLEGSNPDSRSYVLPQQLVEDICALFFGIDISPGNEQYALNYSADFAQDSAIRLTCTAQEPLDGGGAALTFSRTYEGQRLYSVVYTFAPTILAEEPSAPLSQRFHKGDTVWQIASVTNQTRSDELIVMETREISTVQDLLAFAELVNSGDQTAQRAKYLLTADLDLAGIDFTPIGSNRRLIGWWEKRDPTLDGFNGVFDGQGHTISNLTVAATAPTEPEQPLNTGLFSVIGERGSVKNLTLENCTVTSPTGWVPNALSMSTGLLAGLCSGQVDNCRVGGAVTGNYAVGGLVGSLDTLESGNAQVQNCLVDATVSGHTEIGVFAGSIHWAKISNCAAVGEVRAIESDDGSMPHAAGGFVGHSVAADVTGCISSATVKTMVPSEWVGAFMAYNQGTIADCRYDVGKAPGWEAVDVVYGDAAAASNVTAISSDEAIAAIAKLMAQPDEGAKS